MRRIILVAFEGAQTLDVTGPSEVFGSAERNHDAGYSVIVASTHGGLVKTSSVTLETTSLSTLRPTAHDTVLVVGGNEKAIRGAIADHDLTRWVHRASRTVERLGSVCSGAFILASIGLLDGRRAATHWASIDRLRSYRPAIDVERDALFVHDGLWTSAGVTAGIDMCLAMVEQDHGAKLATAIAANLVLYARRPGFQSQFSDALVAQVEADDPLGRVIERARRSLKHASPSSLATWAAMSSRTFHRRCIEHTGLTPARLIQRIKVEAARAQLTTTRRPSKTIADACGFGSEDAMVAAFRRELGLRPREVRLLHQAPRLRRTS